MPFRVFIIKDFLHLERELNDFELDIISKGLEIRQIEYQWGNVGASVIVYYG